VRVLAIALAGTFVLCALLGLAPLDVLAPQDALVRAARHPLLQLGRADRMHLVGEREGVEDLVDDVEAFVGLQVFVGLRQEGIEVHLAGVECPAGTAGSSSITAPRT